MADMLLDLHDADTRRPHVLADSDGWDWLKECVNEHGKVPPELEPLGVSLRRLMSVDVFRTDRDGCPCTDPQ